MTKAQRVVRARVCRLGPPTTSAELALAAAAAAANTAALDVLATHGSVTMVRCRQTVSG
jgi:hypothetical protein